MRIRSKIDLPWYLYVTAHIFVRLSAQTSHPHPFSTSRYIFFLLHFLIAVDFPSLFTLKRHFCASAFCSKYPFCSKPLLRTVWLFPLLCLVVCTNRTHPSASTYPCAPPLCFLHELAVSSCMLLNTYRWSLYTAEAGQVPVCTSSNCKVFNLEP